LPEFFGWLGVGADEEERVSREVVVP
jgi:hypothetical protein